MDTPLHPNYRNFTGGSAPASPFALAAYIGLVNFDDAGELLNEILIFLHSETNAMSHVPSGLVGDGKFPLELLGRDALLRAPLALNTKNTTSW